MVKVKKDCDKRCHKNTEIKNLPRQVEGLKKQDERHSRNIVNHLKKRDF
jgi:hypothetical protein